MSISLRISFVTQNFQRVLLGSQEDNVALWGKDAASEPSTGGQHGADLCGHHDLALGAVADREGGDPDTAGHQHAEGRELGFTEGVRRVPGQESQGKCPQG